MIKYTRLSDHMIKYTRLSDHMIKYTRLSDHMMSKDRIEPSHEGFNTLCGKPRAVLIGRGRSPRLIMPEGLRGCLKPTWEGSIRLRPYLPIAASFIMKNVQCSDEYARGI